MKDKNLTMDPHLINLETGTLFETGIFSSLSDLTIDQINFYHQFENAAPGNYEEILSWPICLN